MIAWGGSELMEMGSRHYWLAWMGRKERLKDGNSSYRFPGPCTNRSIEMGRWSWVLITDGGDRVSGRGMRCRLEVGVWRG